MSAARRFEVALEIRLSGAGTHDQNRSHRKGRALGVTGKGSRGTRFWVLGSGRCVGGWGQFQVSGFKLHVGSRPASTIW